MTTYLNKARISIPAGQDFAGTEFAANFDMQKSSAVMRVLEIDLLMGVESKIWIILKVLASGESFILRQSGVAGVPGADTTTSVVLFGDACNVILETGDSIQFVTVGATSEMLAQVYIAEY